MLGRTRPGISLEGPNSTDQCRSGRRILLTRATTAAEDDLMMAFVSRCTYLLLQ